MSRDAVQWIGGSKLQHGELSNRVYLMRLESAEAHRVIDHMQRLSEENNYTKLIAKLPGKTAEPFLENGFTAEAEIPDFFSDGDSVLFMAKYLSGDRSKPGNPERLDRVLASARRKAANGMDCAPPEEYRLTELDGSHVKGMAELYSQVFETYPFPIFDSGYLAETMEENFRYFGAIRGKNLAALASSEMDDGCVEMTDFATHPEHRRAGLAGHILDLMEKKMRKSRMKAAFTIARARSYGINILFSRAGYSFAGTLINNTGISGRLESMNVWYKPL